MVQGELSYRKSSLHLHLAYHCLTAIADGFLFCLRRDGVPPTAGAFRCLRRVDVHRALLAVGKLKALRVLPLGMFDVVGDSLAMFAQGDRRNNKQIGKLGRKLTENRFACREGQMHKRLQRRAQLLLTASLLLQILDDRVYCHNLLVARLQRGILPLGGRD